MSAGRPDEPLDAAGFRQAAGRYATGVTVVTTRSEGQDHAMTANSFTSVSLDPLLVLVCVERDSRFHEAVLEAGTWAVSVLDAGARRHARWFATRGRPLVGQFGQVPHHRGTSDLILLDEAIAWFECRTTDLTTAGDHDILVGEVTRIPAIDPDRRPLLYWSSGYHELGDPIPGG